MKRNVAINDNSITNTDDSLSSGIKFRKSTICFSTCLVVIISIATMTYCHVKKLPIFCFSLVAIAATWFLFAMALKYNNRKDYSKPEDKLLENISINYCNYENCI